MTYSEFFYFLILFDVIFASSAKRLVSSASVEALAALKVASSALVLACSA